MLYAALAHFILLCRFYGNRFLLHFCYTGRYLFTHLYFDNLGNGKITAWAVNPAGGGISSRLIPFEVIRPDSPMQLLWIENSRLK